jgi:YD repeat-containing protein
LKKNYSIFTIVFKGGMKMRNLLLLVACLIVAAFSQNDISVFADYKMQPEVYAFPEHSAGEVNSKGDLSISIPIATVPGRNGLDFPIAFSYSSGIKVEAMASWVGLGWNFNPGSITRDVMGHLQEGLHSGPDFAEAKDNQPDRYFVTLPGRGTFEMKRTSATTFNQNTNEAETFLAPYNPDGFYIVDYRPYKIEYFTDADLIAAGEHDPYNVYNSDGVEDIAGFNITTDDGMCFIFRAPSKTIHRDLEGLGSGIGYVNAWRLVAILDPLCPRDGNYTANYLEQHPGNWVTFSYVYIPRQSENTSSYYLTQITTPTHEAIFTLSGNRQDWNVRGKKLYTSDWAEPMDMRKIDQLEIIRRGNNATLKTVILEHSYDLAEYYPFGLGKLTLEAIDIYEGPASANYRVPGYRFAYAYNPVYQGYGAYMDGYGYYNTSHIRHHSGNLETFSAFENVSWGDFNDEDFEENYDGSAWSLTKIVFPAGASEEYYYQNDIMTSKALPFAIIEKSTSPNEYYIDDTRTFSMAGESELLAQNLQIAGGCRVIEIIRRDGMGGNPEHVYYGYGQGRVNGFPHKLLPYLNFPGMGNATVLDYNINMRGQADVYYDRITKIDIENGVTETYYLTDLYQLAGLDYAKVNESVFLSVGANWVAFSEDDAPGWGKPYKVIYRKDGDYEKVTETIYDFGLNRIVGQNIIIPGASRNYSVSAKQFHARIRKLIHREKFTDETARVWKVDYKYHPHTGKVMSEKTTYDDRIVEHVKHYAHDIYASDSRTLSPNKDYRIWYYDGSSENLRAQNMLAPVARELTYVTNSLGVRKLVAVNIQTYKMISPFEMEGGRYWWGNDRSYTMHRDDYPATLAELSFPQQYWDNDILELDDFLRTSKIEYDDYRQVENTYLPNGSVLRLFYGDNGHSFSNDVSSFNHSVITGMRYEKDGQILENKIDYNDFLTPERIYDENDRFLLYAYDSRKRLQTISRANNTVLSEYQYHFSRPDGTVGNFDLSRPNYIQTSTAIDSDNTLVSRSYFSGQSVPLQTLIESELGVIYQAQTHDTYRRVTEAYDAYLRLDDEPLTLTDDGLILYDPEYRRRDRNGNLYPEPGSFDYTIQAASNYDPEVPAEIEQIIDVSQLPYDTLDCRFYLDFFDLAGNASIRISFADGRPDIFYSAVEAVDTLFSLRQYRKDFSFARAGASPITVFMNTQINPDDDISRGKKYIYALFQFEFPRQQSPIATYYSYYGNTESKRRISYPSIEANGYGSMVKSTYRFRPADEIIDDIVIRTITDTVYYDVPVDINTYVESRNLDKSRDSKVFSTNREQPFTFVWTGTVGNTGGAATLSVSSDADPDFSPIYAAIESSGRLQSTYAFIMRAGKSYRFSVWAESDGSGSPTSSEIIGRYHDEAFITTNYDYSLLEVENIDENGNRSYIYSNASGKKVQSVQKTADGDLTTYFVYDHNGNLTTVYTPNCFNPPGSSHEDDWKIHYSYNTQGQLLSKETPDDGITTYAYDRSGNVVFSRDAEDARSNRFRFTTYDFAGRVKKIGWAPGNFTALDPDTYSPSSNNVVTEYFYDSKPSAGNFADEAHNHIDAFVASNPKGRLVASKTKSNDKWQITLYSYTDYGQVDKKWILTEGIDPDAGGVFSRAEIEYTYNLAGLVTEKKATFAGETWQHRYTYNERMLVTKAEVNGGDGWVEVASYNYNPAGLVDDYTMRKVSGEPQVVYGYNNRNWLTSINNVDAANPIFAAKYSYLPNGNIAEAIYHTDAFSSNPKLKFAYTYDEASRLLGAQAYYPSGSNWYSTNRFRVSGLAYDSNGNITRLMRYDEDYQIFDNLTYAYNSSNRLQSMSDAVAATSKTWDAEDTGYTYDAAGRVTNINRTGGADVDLNNYNMHNLPERIVVDRNTETLYRYSGDGQRYYKKTDGNTGQYYFMDGMQLLGVFDEDGNLLFWNIYGNDLIGRFEP